MNYDQIKQLAKELRMPVTQLIALAPQNDPFYMGTPRDKTMGAWFRDLWQEFGYSTGVHIRRMHYAIVSQNPPVSFPNGKPYKNTEECWSELTYAAKAARYLEYVDPSAFVDRRNDEPVVYQDFYTTRRLDVSTTDVDDTEEIAFPSLPGVPSYDLRMSEPQRYHLEVWCEKSTMNDVLEPLVRRYNATLLYGKGELSITAALQAINRFKRSDKPVRIFYVSDFDPAGDCMPVSMSRKLEYFIDNLGLNLDIKLFPVVLTYAQTKQYPRLLPTPIKDTERRKAGFEARYGIGAIELDALEALYPGELRRILAREMDRYYDHGLNSKLWDAKSDLREKLEETQQAVYDGHAEEIQAIEDEWQAIQDTFKEQLTSHMAKRIELWQAIRDELEQEQPCMDTDEVPESKHADERYGALYDSERSYLEQNAVYQAHKSSSVDSIGA